jgi:hypothetical protein
MRVPRTCTLALALALIFLAACQGPITEEQQPVPTPQEESATMPAEDQATIPADLEQADSTADAYAVTWNWANGLAEPWVPRESGWSVEDGRLHHPDPFVHGGMVVLTGVVLDEVTVEADMRIEMETHATGENWGGIMIGSRNQLSSPHPNGVLVLLRANGALDIVAGSETIPRMQTGLRPVEAPVRMNVSYKDGNLTVSLDGKEHLKTQAVEVLPGEIVLGHYGTTVSFGETRVEGVRAELAPLAEISPEHPVPVPSEPVSPLPRIAVRKGVGEEPRFVIAETGEPFWPRGFNQAIIRHKSHHSVFNLGIYDPEEMEEMLSGIAGLGGNVLRVWVWGVQDETGYTGTPDSRGLNGAYMENIVDFLRRATRHGVYIMPIIDETPQNAYYDNITLRVDQGQPMPGVTGYNRQYLTPGLIAAKAQAAADFIAYIKAADPGLLNTVFAWALANEAFVVHKQGPFHLESGTVTTTTGTYDMADTDSRQRCLDEGWLHWANTIAPAIREADPDTLVTAGMWTSDAHARPPVNAALPDDKDPRRPPRPSVLGGPDSLLDFIDVHIYPWDGTGNVNLEAHERTPDGPAYAMPAIVGEYGVFKNKTADEAKEMMRTMLTQAYAAGYCGDLHWVWDMTEVEGQTWSSVEEGIGAFLMQLDPRNP